MSDSNGRHVAAAIALIPVGLAVLGMSLAVWGVLACGSLDRAQRERAYPMPETECADGGMCAQSAVQIQAREAAAAEAAVESAVFQSALSLAGLILVALTAYYAHKAWREAEKSADAARKAFEADNRTWVTIQATDLADITVTDGKPHVRVTLEVKNIGQQPAFDVQIWSATFVARGMGVVEPTRIGVVNMASLIAEKSGAPGLTLTGGQHHKIVLSTDAEADPATDAQELKFLGDHAIPPRPRVLSIVYCVHYRSPGSDAWRSSEGMIMVSRKPFEDLPDNGVVPRAELDGKILPHATRMT